MNYYYAMHKDFAEKLLLKMRPKAAPHGDFYVIGEMVEGFEGEILPLHEAGLDETGETGVTPEQLRVLVDSKLAEVHIGKLIIMTKPQGRWLQANHPAFKSVVKEEI